MTKKSTMRDEREQSGERDGLYASDWEPNKPKGIRISVFGYGREFKATVGGGGSDPDTVKLDKAIHDVR